MTEIVIAVLVLLALGFLVAIWLMKYEPPKSYCPLCGLEYVQWTEWKGRGGGEEERLWEGCPVYRDSTAHEYAEQFLAGKLHGAYWRRGAWRSQFDPQTGKPH